MSAAHTGAQVIDFEQHVIGEAFGDLTLDSGLSLSVETANVRTNRVFNNHDGHGAIGADNSNFLKLAGGTTTFNFNQIVTGVSFQYSDLEWAAVTVYADGDPANSLTLEKTGGRNLTFFGMGSEEGFASITLAWSGRQNDGVGLDNLTVYAGSASSSIPATGAGATLMSAMILACGRRRRQTLGTSGG